MEETMSRPPLSPFTAETAAIKARKAEDAWNTREPERVTLAYTEDSRWRNRAEFFSGRAAIVEFLVRKWQREMEYRLIKEIWAFTDDRIAVRFAYGMTTAATGTGRTATSSGSSTRSG
jgi:nuclear transport factor 2 (NTF2) superfamily protein